MVLILIWPLFMKLNISYLVFSLSLLLFIFFLSCSYKIEAPNSVYISENITAKKSYFDEDIGCTIYFPYSKDGSFVKQIIYFVYYENMKFIVRGDADPKNCL